MNMIRPGEQVRSDKWSRYRYGLTTPLGADGRQLCGCAEHIALSRKIAGEGMVLLENNGILPLKEGTTVALFGVGTLEYIKSGCGSGFVFPAYVRNIYEGFAEKAPRIKIFEPLSQFYYDYAAPQIMSQKRTSVMDVFPILPEPAIPAELLADAAVHADVAIIVIHRDSGERSDRSSGKGDFYLTDEEQKLIDDVTSAFSRCVAVLNVGAIVDVCWIRNNPKISGALLAWQGGMEGGLAIADILCGDVNPSGKLVDTFAKSFLDYPSSDTFNESKDYVEYYEDIYVGYRYFETIPGAAEKVNYPFGYGLSYTTFSFSKPEAALDGDRITVSFSVTNTGSLAGKEVAQVYFSAPQGRLGKSALSLVGFHKTRLLSPGEAEQVCVSFPVSDMASYDDLGKCRMSAYVLEQGDYRFFVGSNVRTLQECEYRYAVTEAFVVTCQLQQRCAPNLLRKRMLSDGSFEELPSFPILRHEISAPVNTAAPILSDKPLPLWMVANGKITLDEFISQMTDQELIGMVSGIPSRGAANTAGMGGIDRLGIPAVMTVDGPAGIRLNHRIGVATTAWPCATLVACTWNPELACQMGRSGALEAKEMGLAIWLTPALNIHRNPLCGRNFEYYSEDPLIAGKFAAAKVRGIQSAHTAASAKHFAANNKEANRYHSDSRVSERALREIYLRGFEICVKESQPWTVMTSYNLINARRACECHELIEGILRQEWGFTGMVTTDWGVPCEQANCVLAGNDIRMPGGFPAALTQALADGRLQRGHLETCVKRILEMILKLD